MEKRESLRFNVSEKSGEVSGLLNIPEDASALLVFAHGAGAPMEHPFMSRMSELLAEERIATLRFNFPYTEKKSKRIDPAPVLKETIHSAVEKAKEYAGDIPLLAGGKSMGGRMTSLAASEDKLEVVKGLVFFGFPLHAPGKPSIDRADHLYNVKIPMLFLQGTRDKLAALDLLQPVITKIGEKGSLHKIEGADHSFHLLKSSGRSDEEVLKEMAVRVRVWVEKLIK
jgi:uncharacterized protein